MNLNRHTEAERLNEICHHNNPAVLDLLSEKGKAIYYPRKGILQQGKEAEGKTINATIGMAFEEDGSPIRLPSVDRYITLTPEETYPYAPSFGLKALREQWRDFILTKNPSLSGPVTLPIVTSGLTHGLHITGYMFLDPGDKLIIPEIMWGNYHLIFRLGFGAEFLTYPLFKSGGFNMKGLEASLAAAGRKKIVLLNFPNNPTGYTCTEAEAEQIVSLLIKAADAGDKIAVIIDDAYFGLVYEPGIYQESLFARLARCHRNILAVKVDGATKEDYAWGFRVGFLTYGTANMDGQLCTALEDKTGGAIRGNISSASHISQSLLLRAMTSAAYSEEKAIKYRLLKTRYETVKKVLAKHGSRYAKYFSALPYNSGYFLCFAMNNIPCEPLRQLLLKEYSIGVIATNNLIRIAYSSVANNQIPTLFESMYRACENLQNNV